ncbi:MAG: FAD-dependent oxidoreductase [Trebonia sp.]
MSATGPRVLIIGAGIGGLCLAQGLHQAGVPVAVYERDQAPDARLQGYRLNIEPMGSHALHDCLPGQLWDLLVRTAGDPGPGMNVFTERMRHLMREPGQSSPDPVKGAHAVSRATLRRILLAGLGDIVTFGKEFTSYDRGGDQVTARFVDGTTAAGTVLVGADGARSRVRRQLLPQARVITTGGLGIGGKLTLDEQATRWLPEPLALSKNMILPHQDFLFTAAFRRRINPATDAGDLSDRLAEAGIDAAAALREATEPDYVMWAYVTSGRHQRAISPAGQGAALQTAVATGIGAWDPVLRRLITESDPATVSPFEFTAALPVRPWRDGHVTLLGDAIHQMPPVGGIGGNIALCDARDLCQALTAVHAGRQQPADALAGYEDQMLSRGFAAVRSSRRYLTLAISGNPALRRTARGFFRLCGAVPPLRQAVFAD